MNISELRQFNSIHEIIKSFDNMSFDELKEILAYILKIYIMDKDISYEGAVCDNVGRNLNQSIPRPDISRSSSFAELIKELKDDYSFPELKMFSIEKDNIYITINEKKQLLSANGAAQAPNNPGTGAQKQPSQQSPRGANSNPERFKNLEMD